jgi:hypothetical protein
VVCTSEAGKIALDLEDPLGGAAHRWFSSLEGAAAFLVSWSRRPLPQDGTDLERIASPGATSPTGAAAGDDRWRGEFRLAYSGGPFVRGWWGAAEGAAVRHHGIWRYGAATRVMSSSVTQLFFSDGQDVDVLLGLEVEAVAGVEWRSGRFMLRNEVAAGGAYLTAHSQQGALHFQTAGPRAGVRASLGLELAPTLWLDLSGGWDVLQQAIGDRSGLDHVLDSDPIIDQMHLEIGLLWAP